MWRVFLGGMELLAVSDISDVKDAKSAGQLLQTRCQTVSTDHLLEASKSWAVF